MNGQDSNSEISTHKGSDKAAHKSLQEYVEQVQKAQKSDPVCFKVLIFYCC